MSRSKRMAYAIEEIARKREMIGRTSFHIRVSGILDISFLCARIPFQRLTWCYSFYKSAVQPLPRTFLKNRRAFVLSLHISRSTFERSIISEESQSSINARHEDAFMSSRSREIPSFVKKGISIWIPRIERREWLYYVPDMCILRSYIRTRNLQLSLRKISRQLYETVHLQ